MTIKGSNAMTTNRKLILTCLIALTALVIGGYIFLTTGSNTNSSWRSKTNVDSATATMQSSMPGKGIVTNGISVRSDVTYRPGQARLVKQYTGPIDQKSTTSYWWLYAQSDEEARWLDFYGYPTPSEEARLRSSTDAELKSLADAGDLNAKTHQFIRAMVTAIKTNDERIITFALGPEVSDILGMGAGYQATTIMQGYAKMLSEYGAIPENERTKQQYNIVLKLAPIYNVAQIQAEMFGDVPAETLSRRIYAESMGGFMNHAMFSSVMGTNVAISIGNNARDRESAGVPPLVIKARPLAPQGDNPIYLERN